MKFKFQAKDSFFGIFLFWRFEKRIALSEKKPPLVSVFCCTVELLWNEKSMPKYKESIEYIDAIMYS